MYKEIKIGTGDHLSSAIVVFGIIDDDFNRISENRTSYWIYDNIFGYKLIIMKDTVEGKTISKMIGDNENINVIENYIDSLVIDSLSKSEMMDEIKKLSTHNYENGFNDGVKSSRS